MIQKFGLVCQLNRNFILFDILSNLKVQESYERFEGEVLSCLSTSKFYFLSLQYFHLI